MAKTGRPAASLDDWLDWQQRLESQKASGLSVGVFCLQEGVSVSRFFHWQRQLKYGIPAALLEEKADRRRAESAFVGTLNSNTSLETLSPEGFLPIELAATSACKRRFLKRFKSCYLDLMRWKALRQVCRRAFLLSGRELRHD